MNKNTLTVSIVIIVIILIIVFVFSNILPKQTKQTLTTPIIPSSESSVTVQPIKTDTTQLSKRVSDSVAQKEKDKLVSLLPISLKNISTSVGIETNANIFSISSEPSQVIHIEIYGINYNLSDPDSTNPQAVAFVETFNYIKSTLSPKGINLNNLQIIFGNRDYIQTTAEDWIKAFSLLP